MQRIYWVALFLLFATACGLAPEKVRMDDPRVVELLTSAKNFDRTQYGFTPLPTNGDVRLETAQSGRAYDRMLHFYGRTSRTIAFQRTPSGWRWIHEQEVFQGPKKYTTVDGTFNESICLTYETECVAHYRTNQLNVAYSGEDPRLTQIRELRLNDIRPILCEWGY